MAKKDEEIDVFQFFKRLNLNYALLVLGIIVLLGFYLRMYHYQYPVIGYHNWKVTHYATEARNFAREGFFKYGFFVPMRDTTETIKEQPDGAHQDTFPAIQIVVALLFRIFGENIAIARLAGIFFSLASVVVFYLLVKELFHREGLALLAAFLAAISPLYVFFSHNVDVINPGLFFMLLGAYFYMKWLNSSLKSPLFLMLGSLFVMLGAITKYTFAVIIIPVAFTFPYKEVYSKFRKYQKEILLSAVIGMGFPAWVLYMEGYVKKYVYGLNLSQSALESIGIDKLIDFSIIFNGQFWSIMRSYVSDNYTLLGIFFAFLGIVLFLLLFTKNKAKAGYRFVQGYLLGMVAFVFIMGFKLSGHNYHQFPIAPLVILMIAFFIDVAAANAAKMLGKFSDKAMFPKIVYVAAVILLFFLPLPAQGLFNQSMISKNRMFNTQFPGLDVAGYYINEHSLPDERVFHSSAQSFGVLWHADRKGYKPPKDAEYWKEAEDIYNVSWVFAYQWGINSYFQNPELMEYMKNNYRLVQIAFIAQGEAAAPIYFLFRKGGTFNENLINEYVRGKPVYEVTYYYINDENPLLQESREYKINYINIE